MVLGPGGAKPTARMKCPSYAKAGVKTSRSILHREWWVQQPHMSVTSGFTWGPPLPVQRTQGHEVELWQQSGGQCGTGPQIPDPESPFCLPLGELNTPINPPTTSLSFLVYNQSKSWNLLGTSRVPGPVPGLSYIFIHLNLQPLNEIATISISILQVRKLKLDEIRQLVQGHTGGKCLIWDDNLESSHILSVTALFFLTVAMVPPPHSWYWVESFRCHLETQIRNQTLPWACVSDHLVKGNMDISANLIQSHQILPCQHGRTCSKPISLVGSDQPTGDACNPVFLPWVQKASWHLQKASFGILKREKKILYLGNRMIKSIGKWIFQEFPS